MPTLQFKGKAAIWNHHLSVPYHTLEEDRKLHYKPEKGDGNLIIEGDNLLALKALLPQYAGKIKCIYIDPPYNTGKEHWVFNDNVNSPLIKEWIGKEVGKDDLTRHDKWLCMMVPRLKLLRELLADDGVIFISIDDNENHNLRSVMDEIFMEENFLSQFIWKSDGNFDNQARIKYCHEYILAYCREIDKFPHPSAIDPNTPQTSKLFKDEIRNTIVKNGPGNPISTIQLPPGFPAAFTKGKIEKHSSTWPHYLNTAVIMDGLLTNEVAIESGWSSKDLILAFIGNDCMPILDRKGQETIFEITENGTIEVIKKRSENQSHVLSVLQNLGNTQSTSAMLKQWGVTFKFPKPIPLIKYLISMSATSPDSIILDSFAGSGTTMHAVMELNKEDGGNRKCILVQMTEADEKDPKKNICKDITRERVKRAIDKNGYESGFRYLRVGQPIDAETMLAGNLPSYKDFAKYVYYLCTGQHLPDEKSIVEKEFFVGLTGKTGIYLIYKKDPDALSSMALNLSQAEAMRSRHPEGRLVVYAPACFLDEEYMREHGIEFVSIPYGMFTKTGERA